MKIFVGTLVTRHFDFAFYGKSRAEVIEQAREGWKRHCEVYVDAYPEYMEEAIRDGDLCINEVTVPSATRDREEI